MLISMAEMRIAYTNLIGNPGERKLRGILRRERRIILLK
jgi:hypothetical protein